MRPLAHPTVETISVAGVLHALSDPVRIAIVAELVSAECPMSCTATNERLEAAMPKSTCSQHYRILREAGVIWSERKGVELTSRVRIKELESRFPSLLRSILEAYQSEILRDRRGQKKARRAAR
jgi:DNA-binding transcriptional ArsR family regulator